MFNAVKNAKVVGVILLLFGLYNSLQVVRNITDLLSHGSSFVAEDIFTVFMVLLSPISGFVVGYGLYKQKLWGVFGIGILAIIRILSFVWISSIGVAVSTGDLLVVGVDIVLFLWFFSSRKQFAK